MAKYTKEMFIRDKYNRQMENEWDIVTITSIYKEELKKNEAERGVILSYANALNCITNSLIQQNHSSICCMKIGLDSLTIPLIFLARHTLELVLKYLCNLLNIEYKPKHGLVILWDQIVPRIKRTESLLEDDLNYIKIFISAMEELDCDGSHSRYSNDNKGKIYNDKAKFINAKNINAFIQGIFVKLVEN